MTYPEHIIWIAAAFSGAVFYLAGFLHGRRRRRTSLLALHIADFTAPKHRPNDQ